MPKTKQGKTSRQRRKERRKMEDVKQPEALALADDPEADIKAENEYDDTTPFEEWLEMEGIEDEELPEIASEELGKDIEEIEEIPEEIIEEVVEQMKELEDAEEKEEEKAEEPVCLTSYVQDKQEVVEEEVEWEPSEKELDEIEAEMWASFVDVNMLEKWLTKAKLTTAARNKLPDSAFACVKDGKRHLPIHDKAHVRNALARIPQMLKRGGKSAAVARCGMSKVKAAAKKMGIGKAGKEKLNGILVEKDTAEAYRWIGWVSNNFKDRDGEIISEAAHKDFVDYLDKYPEQAPEFWTWHTKGTAREGKADAWLYHEGFLIMSGPLTDIEAYRLMKAISSDDIGMSHGFFALRDPDDPRVIIKYRAYEVSDLLLRKAANTWTSIETHLKEVSSMSEKLEYLKVLVGEERVDGLLEQAEDNKDFLEELGIESKDKDEPEAEPVETEEEETEEEGKELSKRQHKAVEEYFGMPADEVKGLLEVAAEAMPIMAENIVKLKETVQGFEESKEDALADMIGGSAASKAKALQKRPSANDENVVKKDEKVEGPGLTDDAADHWLAEVFNVEPLEREDES